LLQEGIQIKNDQVVNFRTHYWDPQVELDINKQ
jgi:hypothetical protein